MCTARKIASLIFFLWSIIVLTVFSFTPAFAGDRTYQILAHRGLHQIYSPYGIGHDSCTAAMIELPKHSFIENTIASMGAAIELGADIVEFDIHPTTDGEFVVFHDWTLDCRTNGHGVVRQQNLAYLKTLDIGYGYTADGGKTYPFRGKFIGAMPTLSEVLTRFPNTRFLINIKGKRASEAELLTNYLNNIEQLNRQRLFVYGNGGDSIDLFAKLNADIVTLSVTEAKTCLVRYVLFGWAGYLPEACHHSIIPVPANYQWLIWGWPAQFEARLNAVGSRSMLTGERRRGKANSGIDSSEDLKHIPEGYTGIVFTNQVDLFAKDKTDIEEFFQRNTGW